MSRRINISESRLIKLIEQELEAAVYEPQEYDIEDEIEDEDDFEVEGILSPEEIVGLLEDQIIQLQGRVDYSEELLADVLEYIVALMGDLEKSEDLNLRRSRQKLRALETRAGREMFWLKSRRL